MEVTIKIPRPVLVGIAAVVLALGFFFLYPRTARVPAVTTVNALYWREKVSFPPGLSVADTDPEENIFLTTREWDPQQDYHQMRNFFAGAPHDFVLRAPGHADIHFHVNNSNYSTDGHWQAYGASMAPDEKAKMVRGVPYQLLALNDQHPLRWQVLPEATLVKP